MLIRHILRISYVYVATLVGHSIIMLKAVLLGLRINGCGFLKWVWLAKFPQNEPPLKNPAYARHMNTEYNTYSEGKSCPQLLCLLFTRLEI